MKIVIGEKGKGSELGRMTVMNCDSEVGEGLGKVLKVYYDLGDDKNLSY